MTKFTPGPWIVAQPSWYDWQAEYKIYKHDGNFPALFNQPEIHAANARLIAAAPELYEALQKVLDNETSQDFGAISALLARIDGDADA